MDIKYVENQNLNKCIIKGKILGLGVCTISLYTYYVMKKQTNSPRTAFFFFKKKQRTL